MKQCSTKGAVVGISENGKRPIFFFPPSMSLITGFGGESEGTCRVAEETIA